LWVIQKTMKKVDPKLKEILGFNRNETDEKVLKAVKDKKRIACKPCWELKYCPYGPLVEQFPLIPPLLNEVIEHNQYLQECLDTGFLEDGRRLNKENRFLFEKELQEFDPNNYIKNLDPEIQELQCNVFGHICPVYFVAEPFTETEQERRRGRYIPFDIKMRVVRRDNYTCQICGKHLKDNEVEFDHIIPISKGGSSEEHNIRLTCFECNREKSNNVEL